MRNDARDARTVVIEHPVGPDWKLAQTVKPEESTAAVHRFRVTVPAGQTATLDVDEIRPGTTTFQVTDLQGRQARAERELNDHRDSSSTDACHNSRLAWVSRPAHGSARMR